MSVQYRYVKVAVSVVAWSGVLMVATYWSHTPAVFGPYRVGPLLLLGFLAWIAVMADHLANDIVRYWTKKSSTTTVLRQREWWKSRVRFRATEIKAFGMGLAEAFSEPKSCLVNVVASCKRVSRGFMSSESHL